MLGNNPNQKIAIVISFFLNIATALIAIPVLSRLYAVEQLEIITKLLFVGVMFGSLDVLKPVVIEHFSSVTKVKLLEVLLPSILLATVFSILLYFILLVLFEGDLTSLDKSFVTLALFFYIVSTSLWGLLDNEGLVGYTLLVRAICISVMYFLYINVWLVSLSISLPLLICNFISLLVFSILAYKNVSFDFSSVRKIHVNYMRKVIYTFKNNVAKIIIDFTDRVFVGRFFNPEFVVVYNMLYDLTSKANYFSNIHCAYMYPKMCNDKSHNEKFFFQGVCFSSLLLLLSLVLYIGGDYILILYLGDKFEGESSVAAFFILVASLYTLAFYTQSILRSHNRFDYVAKMFLVTAILGVVSIYPLFLFFGVTGVFIALLILKAPGLLLGIKLVKGYKGTFIKLFYCGLILAYILLALTYLLRW